MADVKIIDIDGEQWNIKDQAARDRLEPIENRNTTVFKEITQGDVYLQMAKRNGIVDCFFRFRPMTAIAGQTVTFEGVVPTGWKPAVPTRNQFVTNNDDTYKGQVVFRENGNIDIWSGVGNFVVGTDYSTNVVFICVD